MPKLITFNAPTKEGPVEKTGYVVRLMVGNTRERFILQYDFEQPSVLTHYASGYRLTSLAGLAVAQYVSHPYAYVHGLAGWRNRAQAWVDQKADEISPATFLQMLHSVPVINS